MHLDLQVEAIYLFVVHVGEHIQESAGHLDLKYVISVENKDIMLENVQLEEAQLVPTKLLDKAVLEITLHCQGQTEVEVEEEVEGLQQQFVKNLWNQHFLRLEYMHKPDKRSRHLLML